MLQIGICDDSAEARLRLCTLLERLLDRRSAAFRIFEFSSGEGLLGWQEKHAGELDLVFLDIEMGEMSGMEAARRLRRADESLQLVFVTGYTDYVFDGYSVGALDYLLKPPGPERLEEVLARALSCLHREEPELFFCRAGESNYRIRKDAILYFSSEGRKVSCVTGARTFVYYGKLDEAAEQAGAGFIRIHQRYLVRAGAVDRVDGSRLYLGGVSLPISRAYQQEALLALTRTALE